MLQLLTQLISQSLIRELGAMVNLLRCPLDKNEIGRDIERRADLEREIIQMAIEEMMDHFFNPQR